LRESSLVSWIDDSRREAFENNERVRVAHRGSQVGGGEISRDLNNCLPGDIRKRAVAIGNELILSYEDALAAVGIATEFQIAVLGFDSGEVLGDGFKILDYTGYDRDIPFEGDWKTYVSAMNVEAEHWIKGHQVGENHGYILTSASAREFDKH
jgi:hypothetical protein